MIKLCAFIAAIITWLILRAANPLGSLIGPFGLSIASRLMGQLLATFVVDFLPTALSSCFRDWQGLLYSNNRSLRNGKA